MTTRFTTIRRGYQYRRISAVEAAAERQRELEKTPEYKAKAKAERAEQALADRREAPIFEWEEVNRLIKREMSMSCWDITDQRRTFIKRQGVRVAAIDLRVMYRATAEDDLGVEEGTEDSVTFWVYRNPAKPSEIRVEAYC